MTRRAIPADALASLLADDGDSAHTAAAVARLAHQHPQGDPMTNSTRADLDQQLNAVNAAHDRALAIAAKLYPDGMRVGVMLSSTQKRPSPATIFGPAVCTNHFGRTRSRIEFGVKLDNGKTWRSRSRSISIDMIRPYEECL